MSKNFLHDAKIVSFDVFDTLISRPLFSPFDIFDRVAYLFHKREGVLLPGFRRLRIYAEEEARSNALTAHGFQDVTLLEIYEFLADLYSLDDVAVQKLMALEQEMEFKYSQPRENGWTWFNLALSQNKEVILVSDMYLSSDFILSLLSKTKYKGFVDLFVSSEYRLRKKEGDLFHLVLSKTRSQPKEILHIGDNPVGDVAIPKRIGLKTHQLPRAAEVMNDQSENWKNVLDFARKSRTFDQSIVLGLIANRWFDSADVLPKKNTDYGGDPYVFGYSALGPLVCGFAAWINQQSNQDGVDHLIFLSRDGRIVKDAYERLYPDTKKKISYFYLSRRAVRIAQLKTDADLISICLQPLYSTTIADYLMAQFSLTADKINISVLESLGCPGINFSIGGKFPKEKLIQLILSHRDVIFERATLERNAMVLAYENLGGTGLNSAVIDIGYAGTLQDGLMNVLKRSIKGYYLATFSTMTGALLANPLSTGYLKNLEHPNDIVGGICTHRFVYENIFCDAAPSFMFYESNGVEVTPHFNESHDDVIRRNLVLQVHAGVRVLAEDIRQAMGDEVNDFTLPPDFATRMLDLFMRRPHPVDAAMFQGITFEDANGPAKVRYLVPPRNLMFNEDLRKNSIWKEGVKAFYLLIVAERKSSQSKPGANIRRGSNKMAADLLKASIQERKPSLLRLRLEEKFIKKFASEKLFHKYIRNRHNFFSDSTKPVLKFYFKNFG